MRRKVNYNQSAVLCRFCTKRIRLNNDGKMRVHVAGRAGSDKCMGSNADPFGDPPQRLEDVNNQIEPGSKPESSMVFQDAS